MDISQIEGFILARVQEDGDIAARAGQPWFDAPALARDLRVDPTDAIHVARWTPGRVMLECDLKRQVVISSRKLLTSSPLPSAEAVDYCIDVLRLLASTYEDHPDFREEWLYKAPNEGETPDIVWFRVGQPRQSSLRGLEGWKSPRIAPSVYQVGDIVSLEEAEGGVWRGVVAALTEEHIALQSAVLIAEEETP